MCKMDKMLGLDRCNVGRPAATSRGERTSGRAGRGGGRTRGHSGDQDNGKIGSRGGQVGGQGSEVNDGVDGVSDFSTIISQQLQNLLPTIVAHVGDQGRGQENGRNQNGNAVNDNIRGDKMESVQDMSGCKDNQKVKYTASSFVGKALSGGALKSIHEVEKLPYVCLGLSIAYTGMFHELARLVSHFVTLKGKRIERYVYGLALHIQGMVATTEPKTIQKAVQIAGTLIDEALRNGSIKKNHEKIGNGGEPRKDKNVRDENKRTRTGNAFAITTNLVRRENTGTIPKCTTWNTHHPPEAPCRTCFNCNRLGHFAKDCRGVSRNVNPINARNPTVRGRRNQWNQARGKAFMLGAEEARQDPNIMTGMDWLSDHKAMIICHEKVVRIPLLDGKVLRVLEEKPKEKVRHLVSVKAKEQKRKKIVAVRDFFEVFLDDLSGLPHVWEIKFRIELIPGVMSVVRSPYRLEPSELEELSGQLKELQDKDEMIKLRDDEALYYLDQIWVPLKGDMRTLIIDEAHKSKYSVHPGADKMYYDLRDGYWWLGMKKDITAYVIVNRLTKSAHFLPMREDYKMDRLARLYLNEIVSSMTDGQSERIIQILKDVLRAYILDFEGSWDVYLPLVDFLYNNIYHSSARCAPFEALYGRKCRSLIMWAEIKDRLKAARDREKSYADKRRKPLEFSVGDYVLLKVSPWKGVYALRRKES
nr:hypothetical protein [Tanacetum cinerariifolium]